MLEIKNVSRAYHGKYALKDVDLTFGDGETWLLLGPNGSGKTTLMKLIDALSTPTQGEILLDGERTGRKTREQIAYMPTENYFYGYMTVRDTGRYYADFFRDFDRNAFDAAIERSRLDPKAAVRNLSSGESAKLRLALTLSRDARVMMLDEPVNGVDMLTRDHVLAEIEARRQSGRIMLISTHLIEEAAGIADHAAFLSEGRVVLSGTMKELCAESTIPELYRRVYGGADTEVIPC